MALTTSLGKFVHDPDATLVYVLDLTDWLEGNTISGIGNSGAAIVSPTTAPPFDVSGLSIESPGEKKISYLVSGGVLGTRYTVTIRVQLAGGNGEEADHTMTFICQST